MRYGEYRMAIAYTIPDMPHPKDAYRCLILDLDIETATFRFVKNKRLINALILCLHPRHVTPGGDSADSMRLQSYKIF